MPRVTLTDHEGGRSAAFRCPGCGDTHAVSIDSPNTNGKAWGFNGDVERPTFTPSLLVRCGHYAGKTSGGCWCIWNKEHPPQDPNERLFTCYVCHSHVRDGRIEFLGDCTHALAGQTVDLLEVKG